MSTVTIGVDLAKHVFEVAVAKRAGTVAQRKRLSRAQFERFWAVQARCRVVMEACAGAHYWARRLSARGFEVVLLPPRYVRPYRRRDKTDRADCEALLEAVRCGGIHPVAVKSENQQAVLALHRARAQWMATRTARINTMRALLHEFGVGTPRGAKVFVRSIHELVHAHRLILPADVRCVVEEVALEVHTLERKRRRVEAELKRIAEREDSTRQLMKIPGIGVLTATALQASVDIHAFRNGRQLACWLGLTPREHSSGSHRRIGRMSKQGNVYLRMLLIHGARAALLAARRAEKAGRPLTQLQTWALERASLLHANKAAVALANKLARIAWAVWYHDREFDGNFAHAA